MDVNDFKWVLNNFEACISLEFLPLVWYFYVFRGYIKRLHVKFVLRDLCDCVGRGDSVNKILRSHICEFCVYITRNKIAVCDTVGGEDWKAEVEDIFKIRVSSTLN